MRERVRAIAGGAAGTHVCRPLQGCGHFIGEAAWRTFVPPGAKVLIPSNGHCGVRMIRLARYTENARVLWEGLTGLGLTPWLPRDRQGPIIVNMLQPRDPAWALQRFVDLLKRRGFLISNFSTTAVPTFRVAPIGRVFPEDMRRAVEAIGETLAEMGVQRREAA